MGESDKMKIIGLILTWNNLEFFKYALEQALDFCDEVLLVEGCHSEQYPQHSDDGTVEYIQTIKTHPKLKIMNFTYLDRYDYTQRRMREKHPKTSQYYKLGNWVFHWDDDLFFMNEDLQKLRKLMQDCKEDSLDLQCRWFFYNFRFNFRRRMSPVCYRITDRLRLTGVSNPHYRNAQSYSISYPDDIVAFHYSWVKKLKRMKARFVLSAEKGTPGTVEERFGMWENIKWNTDEDIMNNNNIKKIMPGGELNIYNGNHPELLCDHPWRHANDVREMQ